MARLAVLAAASREKPRPGSPRMPNDTSPWLLFVSRMHVVLVHFPIGLIIAAGLIEFVRLRAAPQRGRSSTASLCLALGAIGALAAAASGWQLAELEPPGRALERTLFLHRWTGVATAGTALLTLGLGYLQAASVSVTLFRAYRIALVLCVLLVSAAGHFGGEMVHGEDFLFGVFSRPESSSPPASAPPTATPPTAAPPTAAPPTAGTPAAAGGVPDSDPEHVDFASQIEPLLAARCFKCHGPDKVRGKLRLDDMAALFDPAREARWVIRPGAPDDSELVRRISLPADDEDVMPAEGDPLTSAQVALLRRWIEQGARWEGPASR
jgi:uncharacterized membrane protein/mono/diheme cytochrome c family protein